MRWHTAATTSQPGHPTDSHVTEFLIGGDSPTRVQPKSSVVSSGSRPMSQKYVFEELDDATHDYLIAVRDDRGRRLARRVRPDQSSSMAGCGCIAGPIIILVTLLFTLTTWIDVIYDDPARVALLQTAGLLLGGWLLLAAFRSSAAKGSRRVAGHWVYVDPLAPVRGVPRAGHGHPDRRRGRGELHAQLQQRHLPEQRHPRSPGRQPVRQVTLNNEPRAEQMVVFLNYLAWARGEGGDRATLPPASLGGLAKYVSKNDAEPKDAEGNINLNLVELDITEVPEEPTREGRAMPAFLPYIVILVGGLGDLLR